MHVQCAFVGNQANGAIGQAIGDTDILDRIHDHKINQINELLPWNWTPIAQQSSPETL